MTVLALSYREAAQLLRIDRGRTLHALIASGQLRRVPWGTGWRIPLDEVQRLAREGYTVAGRPGRAVSRPRRAAAGGAGARIRAIEIEP